MAAFSFDSAIDVDRFDENTPNEIGLLFSGINQSSVEALSETVGQIVEAVRTSGQVVTKPDQALQVTQIIDAMYRSADLGEAVKL